MKQGKSLQDLAVELERRANTKQDFIAPAEKVRAVVERDNGTPELLIELKGCDGRPLFPVNSHAHGQLAGYLQIPKQYYDRCVQLEPQLAADQINAWLQRQNGKRRLVRTLDGHVRAFLSDGYRAIENEDLAEAVLPVLIEQGVQVVSADITETKFYIKAVDGNITKDIPKGHSLGDGTHTFFDTVSPAIVISNSEVGAGAFAIQTSIWTKACTNLAVYETSLRKIHIGGRAELSDEVYKLLSDKTKTATDAALFGQARDITKGAFAEAQFEVLTQKLVDATKDEIKAGVVEVVERTAKRFGFNEGFRDSVLQHLIKDGDLTRYGLHNAVTRASADVEDYDAASDLERVGGQIIELPRNAWEELAVAA